MRHLWHWAMAGALVVTLVHPGSTALADDLPAPVLGSYNDFGNTGLLQMPNARMAPDGEFAIGSSYVWPYTRYYVTSQFLPWLQGTFRFTSIANRDYGPASKTGQSYKDKGVDVKVRLVPEGPYTPEISAGLRDVGGTGLFSSEYVAMSRRYYDFDFTLGMAWGNAGTRGDFSNPLGLAADSFKSRQASSSTGAFNNNYFRGESVALFGGIEYRTPIEGLRLKLELDGNNYQEEPQEGEFNVASRLNVGAEYQPWSWLNLGLGLERGNKAMFRLTLKSNPSTDMGVPKLNEKKPMAVPVRPAAAPANAAPEGESPSAILGPQVLDVLELTRLDTQSVDIRDNQVTIRTAGSPSPEQVARTAEMLAERLPRAQLSILDGTGMPVRIPEPSREEGNRAEGEQIFNALSVYGFEGRRYFVARDHATLVFSQSSYRQGAKPIGRAARVLANYAPPHVEFFTLILMDNDLPTEKITLLRKDVEKAANGLGSADESWTNVVVDKPEEPPEAAGEHKAPWRMSYDVGAFPHLRQSLGGPDSFLLYQLYMEPTVSVRLFSGFRVEASAGVNIVNNYEKFTYEAPSNMPRVRTRVRDYVKGGDIWVQSLHADYAFPIIPEWYGAVSAGLFEQMYGGVAGEVLYRPQGARWALGLDVNHVWQRTPGETAAFDPYHITTGHLSYYHLTPYHDVYYTLSAGRYLAGDVGVTGVLGRRLENGVEIGIWATKTNVSAAEFGEGSFDKGMYVRIPLDLFYTSPSRQSAAFPFRPLIRDGGQKVATPLSLHGMTGGFKQGASDDGWRDMWR